MTNELTKAQAIYILQNLVNRPHNEEVGFDFYKKRDNYEGLTEKEAEQFRDPKFWGGRFSNIQSEILEDGIIVKFNQLKLQKIAGMDNKQALDELEITRQMAFGGCAGSEAFLTR